MHAHLTGSISRECLHDIWEKKKAEDPAFDVEDPLVAIPSDKVDYNLETYGPSIFDLMPRSMFLSFCRGELAELSSYRGPTLIHVFVVPCIISKLLLARRGRINCR